MAVHIRHGAPGSFKTACAVWFDILAWLRDGRPVYTNIRDIKTVTEIESILGEKFPEGADLIYVDTDSNESRFKFAAWFHWLPIGAAICIDEGQFIYPSRSDFKPVNLDYPGGLDAATEAQRPPDVFTALDKHRHYNWDISVTTPNIKKLPNWLRDVVETAYHHKNMEHIPFYGKRKTREHRHDPSTSGTTINKQSQYQLRKVPVTVHELYGSTITGDVSKNRAESNPLKNPRLIGFLFIAIIAIFSSIYLIFSNGDNVSDVAKTNVDSVIQEGITEVVSYDNTSLATKEPPIVNTLNNTTGITDFFPGAIRIYISGYYYTHDKKVFMYNIETNDTTYSVLDSDFINYGFNIQAISPCSQVMNHDFYNYQYRFSCGSATQRSASLAQREEQDRNLSDPSQHLPL